MTPRIPDDVRATFALMLLDRRVNADNRDIVYQCMAENFEVGRFSLAEIRSIIEDDVEKYLIATKSRPDELLPFIRKGKGTHAFSVAMEKKFGKATAPLRTLKLRRTQRPVAKGASKLLDQDELTDNSSDEKENGGDRKRDEIKRKKVKERLNKDSVSSRASTQAVHAETNAIEGRGSGGGAEKEVGDGMDSDVQGVTIAETVRESQSAHQDNNEHEEIEIDDDVAVTGQDLNSEDIPDYGPPPQLPPGGDHVKLMTEHLMKKFACDEAIAVTACVSSSAIYSNACHWIQTFLDTSAVIQNGLYFYQDEDAKLQAVQNDVTADPELVKQYGVPRLKARLKFLSENDFI